MHDAASWTVLCPLYSPRSWLLLLTMPVMVAKLYCNPYCCWRQEESRETEDSVDATGAVRSTECRMEGPCGGFRNSLNFEQLRTAKLRPTHLFPSAGWFSGPPVASSAGPAVWPGLGQAPQSQRHPGLGVPGFGSKVQKAPTHRPAPGLFLRQPQPATRTLAHHVVGVGQGKHAPGHQGAQRPAIHPRRLNSRRPGNW